MRRYVLAAALSASQLIAFGAGHAQTAEQLAKSESDTHNVLTYGMGYGQQRYSPLTQINTRSVKHLVPAWAYPMDSDRGEEAQPFVYQGVIYFADHQSTVAVDAKTGKQIWKSKIDYPPETPRIVCCGIVNRGVALYDGKVYRATLDDNLIALDAKTGKEVWRQNVIEFKTGYSMTGAPQIADGVIVTGISGADFGTRDFLDGWDPATGKHLWRTYTIPGPGEPGSETWDGDSWQHGGGSTWVTGSYDPELHTLYWGTGNASPFNPTGRKGDNLYTASVLALDPKTGKIKWHYQFTPNDMFDYDGVNELVQATLKIGGKPTKVIMQANRNAFFYVIDRESGKLLAANPFATQNWADKIDMATGRPIESALTARARAGERVAVRPHLLGGKNWGPMSFNPKTGLAYINTLNYGFSYKIAKQEYRPGLTYMALDRNGCPAGGCNLYDGPRGILKAVDPLTGKAKWEVPSDLPRWGGTMTTAGGLIFSGQMTGEFEAFDAGTGKKLWQFQTGSGVVSQPVTWEQDGVQYIAVGSGGGGVYSLGNDERLAKVPLGTSLWVFKLAE